MIAFPRAPHPSKVPPSGCISIIGMAAAGKTTIGRELAAIIDWPQMDTDHVIEATYGARLQDIADAVSKEEFLDIESLVITKLRVSGAVLSTGGSAVYRQNTIDYLKTLGPMIYVDVPLPIILERIRRKPDRGLAVNPGQTIESLYNERKALYEAAADFTVHGGSKQASHYAAVIAEWLETPA